MKTPYLHILCLAIDTMADVNIDREGSLVHDSGLYCWIADDQIAFQTEDREWSVPFVLSGNIIDDLTNFRHIVYDQL